MARYNVLRNGTPAGTTTSPDFTDQNLSPATTYTYRVIAEDAAGNVSDESDPLQASTDQPPPDVTPPSTPANLTSPARTTTSISLSWSASTDDTGRSPDTRCIATASRSARRH